MNIPFIDSILLVNSFSEVDEMLRDTLVKSQEVFRTCPPDMEELADNYYRVISTSGPENRSGVDNPISLEGRI